MELKEILSKEDLEKASRNSTIFDSFVKANSVINSRERKRALCSISGGADSDVMLDLIYKIDVDKKVDYVWFDTGLEYQATKDHLSYLEDKYNIEIIKCKAIKPIPLTVKEFGVPFISKDISQKMYALQNKHFDFMNDGDKEYEDLDEKYDKASSYLQWWCNRKPGHYYNIEHNKYLKEWIIKNPPAFKISDKCCKYAKKDAAKQLIKERNYKLQIIGVRKAEGGIRATSYKNCFSNKDGIDNYRPLFWYSNKDRAEYEDIFSVVHSRCYTEYGMKRTGCAGCPFNHYFDENLNTLKQYEPKLYEAVCNIFKDSHDYTRQYREFRHEMELKSNS